MFCKIIIICFKFSYQTASFNFQMRYWCGGWDCHDLCILPCYPASLCLLSLFKESVTRCLGIIICKLVTGFCKDFLLGENSTVSYNWTPHRPLADAHMIFKYHLNIIWLCRAIAILLVILSTKVRVSITQCRHSGKETSQAGHREVGGRMPAECCMLGKASVVLCF